MSNPIDLCTLADVRSWLSAPSAPVRSTAVVNGGANYVTITITAVPVDGNGSGATFTGVLTAGALTAVLIDTPGAGYTQDPALVITGTGSGAGGAVATASIGDDTRFSRLITNASTMFLNEAQRAIYGLLPLVMAEKRNGYNYDSISTKNCPIISVQSVYVNGKLIPPSPDGVQPGWVNDSFNIYLIGYCFYRGYQNVLLNYTAGYDSIPFDVSQAVIELVGQKYRRSQHIDQDSQRTQDGQVISFSKKDIPPEVQTVIDLYRIKAQIE